MTRQVSAILLVAVMATAPGGTLRAREGDLRTFLAFSGTAPQDIAVDSDGSFWVTSFLDGYLRRFDAELRTEIERVLVDAGPNRYFTGIAIHPQNRDFLLADIVSGAIIEVDRTGLATGREIAPDFTGTPLQGVTPLIHGMAVWAEGDDGQGSLFIQEGSSSSICELRLDGTLLRSFAHPDDPDGIPFEGSRASTIFDVEPIIVDGAIDGFYVLGGRGDTDFIRRLDASGRYTGISIPLLDTGGSVSGILRRPFDETGTGKPRDSYICLVASSARFAVLEGGEPDFKELLDTVCTRESDRVRITWTPPMSYDRIEVLEDCELLATLGGDATEWENAFEAEGVHEVRLRAVAGDRESEHGPWSLTVGPGEVLRSAPAVDGAARWIPYDVALAPGDLLLVSANLVDGGTVDARILVHDCGSFELRSVIDIPESFSGPEDFVTGIAYAEAPSGDSIYVFNATRAKLGVLDAVGALVASFDVAIPDLRTDPEDDPDYGFPWGMCHDPAGDAGRGSLWFVEAARDRIYEIDLEGHILRNFVHPYLALEPPPSWSWRGARTGGIATVAGGDGNELWITGGTLRDGPQVHIARMRKDTGEIVPGSVVPTVAMVEVGESYSFTLENAEVDGEGRFFVLAVADIYSKLLEVRAPPFALAPPVFLSTRQRSYLDEVSLSFLSQGPYDRIEIYRDCGLVAEIDGGTSSFTDTPTSGLHSYSVRGLHAGKASAFARSQVRVGPGAVLQRQIIDPASSPQQIARDPVDSSYWIVSNYPGEERLANHFDANFDYLETRDAAIENGWQIATLAVRAPSEESRELVYLVWKQPVPLGQAASQRFYLVSESLAGVPLDKVEVFPTIPSNGFIVYPTGLAWEPESDTFYFLERNTATFHQVARSGETLRTFPHPLPAFQQFVFTLGVCFSPERSTFFVSAAGRHDFRITEVLEMDREGKLTGVEIPLEGLSLRVTGLAMAGEDLVAVGSSGLPEIVRLKAFSEPPPPFVRGDSDRNGRLDIADAIVTLDHLFRGGPRPECPDGADSDDSGRLSITDAVVLLVHLFLGGPPLPAPYPLAGQDPSGDGLPCP